MPNRRGTPASLEVVGRDVRDLGDEHFDAVLYRIAESALSLTGATGAAPKCGSFAVLSFHPVKRAGG